MMWLYLAGLLPVAFVLLLLLYEITAARLPRPVFNPASKTVLLVDDDTRVCEITAKNLQRRGFMVLSAADGESALNIAKAHPGQIDLLLTDVLMPGMSGPLLAEYLLTIRPLTPVLFISGVAEGDTLPKRHMPRIEFLGKPFTVETLTRKVTHVIEEGGCAA
jgi:two-component system cell cycle sensor histidine kinase/response regulator CckA